MVLCNASAIIEYDRRKSGLSNAPLNMEYGNNITEISPLNITQYIVHVRNPQVKHQYLWAPYD